MSRIGLTMNQSTTQSTSSSKRRFHLWSLFSSTPSTVLSDDGKWLISTIPVTNDDDDCRSTSSDFSKTRNSKGVLRSCLRRHLEEDSSVSASSSSSFGGSCRASSPPSSASLSSEEDYQEALHPQQGQGQQRVPKNVSSSLRSRRRRQVRFNVRRIQYMDRFRSGPCRVNSASQNSTNNKEAPLSLEEYRRLWYSEREVGLMMRLYEEYTSFVQLLEEIAIDDDATIVNENNNNSNDANQSLAQDEDDLAQTLFLGVD